jgi:hypothetical protein
MPDSAKPDKKRRFWEVDPNTFVSSSKLGVRGRALELARASGKYVLWGLALTYPLTLPLIGILFGGIAFWAAFGVSFAGIAVLLSKFGLSRNFDGWDIHVIRSLVGLVGGFLCALGFIFGLFFFKGWLFPIALGILGLAFLVSLRKELF